MSSAGCSGPGDEWFIAKISIDQSTLPTGVIFESGSLEGYDYEVLSNTSAVPFYLTAKKWRYEEIPMNPSGNPTELPAGIIPYAKLVPGEVFYWGTDYGWDEKHLQDDYVISSAALTLESLRTMGVEVVEKRGDNRPENIFVPQPQSFTLNTYYGSRPTLVKGNITYSLNTRICSSFALCAASVKTLSFFSSGACKKKSEKL